MKLRRPSPAMVVAVTALVMASTGSAVAAVNFAKKAGKVDGKSAVAASASNEKAAGKLVATRGSKSGSAGQIPHKFLAQVTSATTFGRLAEVVDNAAGAAAPLNQSDLGLLSATCNDQANAAGNEDPTTTVTFSNGTPLPVNIARTVGANQQPTVELLPAGTAHSFTINGSNTFRILAEYGGVNVVLEGQVRQDGRNTEAATCLVAGTAETFRP
jgi:hypothetical protein